MHDNNDLKRTDPLKPDYVIEDKAVSEDHTVQNRSGMMIFILLILLLVVPLVLVSYEHFSNTYSVEKLTGWYEGNLTFETTENDPEGYYDKYPEYLIAGMIPVVIKVELTDESEGRLTIIDATQRRSDMEYKIWIEDGKLLGEPLDSRLDVETRLDLFGEIREMTDPLALAGSLGIKDMFNNAVAVFNFNANRKEVNLDVDFIDDKGMGMLVKRMASSSEKPDLSGLWLDVAPPNGLRFAIIDDGNAYDPTSNVKITFDQQQFILMYLDDEYEVLPYQAQNNMIWTHAEYLIMDNGKIFVTSDQGSYLIDETIFDGDPLIKVKLGDIDTERIAERIFIDMKGTIRVEGSSALLYMDINVVEASGSKTYNMMLELLDL